jgi:hypothetical protein
MNLKYTYHKVYKSILLDLILSQISNEIFTTSHISSSTWKLTSIAQISTEQLPFCIMLWNISKVLQFLIVANTICSVDTNTTYKHIQYGFHHE